MGLTWSVAYDFQISPPPCRAPSIIPVFRNAGLFGFNLKGFELAGWNHSLSEAGRHSALRSRWQNADVAMPAPKKQLRGLAWLCRVHAEPIWGWAILDALAASWLARGCEACTVNR